MPNSKTDYFSYFRPKQCNRLVQATTTFGHSNLWFSFPVQRAHAFLAIAWTFIIPNVKAQKKNFYKVTLYYIECGFVCFIIVMSQ